MPSRKPPEVEGMSFEQALTRLREINEQFEEGELALEKALALYEEGVQLAKRCEQLLAEARQAVEKVIGEGEAAQAEPFEPEEEV